MGSKDVSVKFCGVVCFLDCAVDPVGAFESIFCSEDCPADFPVFASDLSISDSVEGVSVNDVVCFLGSFDILDVGCLIEVADSLLSEVVALEDSVSTDENDVVVVYWNVVFWWDDTVPCCVVVRIVEPFEDVEVIADVLLVESAGSVLANSDALLVIEPEGLSAVTCLLPLETDSALVILSIPPAVESEDSNLVS